MANDSRRGEEEKGVILEMEILSSQQEDPLL
jgi:hypothetical protein